jgi:hypothetical protein
VEEAMNDITPYQELNRQAQEYNRLLEEAQEVSYKSLERLRELSRRFDLPDHHFIHELEESVRGRP